MNNDFAIAEIETGKLNAMVKNLMKQIGTDDPVEAVRSFNAGEYVIAQPDHTLRLLTSNILTPAEFIGQGWTIWKGPKDGNGLEGELECDKRAGAVTGLRWEEVLTQNVLEKDESSVNGEKRLNRLRATGNIQLDWTWAMTVWKDYQENGKKSFLEWLFKTKKITFLDFPGTVLCSPCGRRLTFFFYRYGDECHWYYDWLDDGWLSSGVGAGLASSPKA